MTDKEIKELIKAIERATEQASKSKASARKFLRDAGISLKQPKFPDPLRVEKKK